MRTKSRRLQEQETIEAKKGLMPLLRPATKEDYINWLKSQKDVVKYTNVPWSMVQKRWYVATNHLLMPVQLYGADSISIIVPAHLYVAYDADIHMQWGHIELYFEKTGKSSYGSTCLYSDALCSGNEAEVTKKQSWFKKKSKNS